MFSDTINTGIYVLEPEIFDYMEAGKNYDFSKDIFPFMLRDGKPLFGYVATDYWSDIGNLQQYQQANYDALPARCASRFPGRRSRHGIWVGEECRSRTRTRACTGRSCSGENVTIERGAVIEELCAIGNSTIVAADATLFANGRVGRRLRRRGGARSPAARSPTA